MTNKRYIQSTRKPASRLMVMLSLLAISACSLIGTLVADPVPPRTATFEYACYKLEQIFPESSCGELAAPMIVYSSIIDSAAYPYSWYGVYYHGEPYIFIAPDEDLDMQLTIILHETAHYIIYELYLIDMDDTCENERLARIVSDGVWDQEQKDLYNC